MRVCNSDGLTRFIVLKHIAIATVALAWLWPVTMALADVVGQPRIIDGDSLEISGERIRLHGIDAPEANQECSKKNGKEYRCGLASTQALRALIGSKPVICKGTTYDRYNRMIAVCYSGTVNLNAELVRKGWALAYRRYSKDYVSIEQEAQNDARGMWVGEFEMPWKWRRR